MGATLTINEAATKMVRLVGDELQVEEAQRNIYEVPPKPAEFEWMITGYALPFELRKQERFIKPGESEFQTKTRLEFTIMSGPAKGRMFTDMYTFSIGERSTLGKLVRRLGVDLTPDPETNQWDLDRLIGYQGKSYVGHGADAAGNVKLGDDNKPKYAQVVVSTVTPISAPSKRYSIVLDPEDQEPVRVGGGNADANDNDGWPEG